MPQSRTDSGQIGCVVGEHVGRRDELNRRRDQVPVDGLARFASASSTSRKRFGDVLRALCALGEGSCKRHFESRGGSRGFKWLRIEVIAFCRVGYWELSDVESVGSLFLGVGGEPGAG